MAKKENALDLAKLIDKGVRVKLSGGREGWTLPWHASEWISYYAFMKEKIQHHIKSICIDDETWHAVEGVLKGYDQLLNLVLDETIEYARGTFLGALGCSIAEQRNFQFDSGLCIPVVMELPDAIL